MTTVGMTLVNDMYLKYVPAYVITCRDLVEMLAFKYELEPDGLDSFALSASFPDGQTKSVTLNQPSRDCSGLTVEICDKTALVKSQSEYILVCEGCGE